MALKKTFKKKWLKALRAEGMHQTTGYLRKQKMVDNKKVDAFCCLGVACNILRPNLWTIASDLSTEPGLATYAFRMKFGYDDSSSLGEYLNEPGRVLNYLPKQLADEIGLTEDDQDKLAKMNDSHCSFAEIADYIEKNL